MISMSVIWALGVSIGSVPAIFALIFKPGPNATPLGWMEYLSVLTFPVLCVVALTGSWILFNRTQVRMACLVASLPVVNVLLFAVSTWQIEQSRGHGYEFVDGEWAFVITARGNRFVHTLGADSESFQVLVTDEETQFARDKHRVWVGMDVVRGADPSSFVPLKGCYGKDKARAYCGNVPFNVTNLDRFEVISIKGFGHQIPNHEYFVFEYGEPFREFEVSHEKPAILTEGWARDGQFYYYGPGRVEGADYASFQIVDDIIARDKNQEFVGCLSRNEREKRRDKK
jgi:hypothetical protein